MKARTRATLIDAARRVFGRRGFHGASLEEIAESAGLTTGAVYSNFAGKEELFLALLDDHVTQRLEATRRALGESSSVEGRVAAAGDEWMRFLRTRRDWFPLFVEFWSWAVRDPRLRRRFAAQYRRFSRANAEFVHELGIELPDELARQAGIVVTALADGLALAKLADPAGVPDDLLAQTLLALLAATPR